MAATKLQLNFTNVSHGATNITMVTAVNFSMGGQMARFAGDTSKYATVVANTLNQPKATVTSGDIATLMGIGTGTVATLNATHKDALKAAGGDIIYAMTNAMLINVDASGSFGQFGQAVATFEAFAPDGVTNPLSFTRGGS